MTGPRLLPVPGGAAAGALLGPLERALGGGSPLAPYAVDAPVPVLPEHPGPLPDGLALAIGTSGSTGPPKRALLTVGNLVSSATATGQVLGRPGTWLLALPAYHIAGIQVLVRSLLAGTQPQILDLSGGFTVEAFRAATRALAGRTPGPRYTALVPTQVARLLGDEAGSAALGQYDAILVGGAATSTSALAAAEAAGLRLVRTYGMSETAGGCVYDGAPLSVTLVRVDDGHIALGGATVAHGYLGHPQAADGAFREDADGTRWFRTGDLGELDPGGRLHVRGRADDVVNTGGLKVAPGAVEEAILRRMIEVREAVVVGSEDPTWGQAVCAAITLRPGAPRPSVRDVRTALRGILPDSALPRRLLVLDEIPSRGPGKPDRRALVAVFDETLEADVRGRR